MIFLYFLWFIVDFKFIFLCVGFDMLLCGGYLC